MLTKHGAFRDSPTEREPASVKCPGCDGAGCDECNGGEFELTCKPTEYVTPDVWDVIELADLYERGLPPVAGGALDQAQSFVSACRFIWSENARCSAAGGD